MQQCGAQKGCARIGTAVAGFRVQSANRYTTRPTVFALALMYAKSKVRGFNFPDNLSQPFKGLRFIA